MAAIPASTLSTTVWPAVGTPAAAITSLAYAFEPSRRAAAALGPKHGTGQRSAKPSTSGASGPTTTRSASSTSSGGASPAIPALPGEQNTSGAWGERLSARTIACSRPPPPMTRTLMRESAKRFSTTNPRSDSSKRGDEVVDRDRHQGLVVAGAARAELEADAGHGLLVRRLDDVHEVEAAQRGPLRLHLGAELLDLAVDLADALGVVLDGLDALRRERREHDVGRHGFLLGLEMTPSTEPPPRMRCSNRRWSLA